MTKHLTLYLASLLFLNMLSYGQNMTVTKLTTRQDLIVGNDAAIAGNVDVTGNITVDGTISGDMTFADMVIGGDIIVEGNSSILGGLELTTDLTLDGVLYTNYMDDNGLGYITSNSPIYAPYFQLTSINGILFGTGIDQDYELMELSVTGGPRIIWDESEHAFYNNVEMQGPQFTVKGTGGFWLEPGSDIDHALISSLVTGGPALTWDESESRLDLNTGFEVAGRSRFNAGLETVAPLEVYNITTKLVELINDAGTGGVVVNDSAGAGRASLEISGTEAGELIIRDTAGGVNFTVDGDVGVEISKIDVQWRDNFSSLQWEIQTDGQMEIRHDDGISFNPASDVDATIFEINVTGAPTLSWDESEDGLLFSKEFRTNASVLGVESADGLIDLGVIDSAGNFRTRTSGGVEVFRVEASSNAVSLYDMDFRVRSSSIGGSDLGGINRNGVVHSAPQTVTLGAAATTFAVTSNFVTLTGDGGGNSLATITGGVAGQQLWILCNDANVTFIDNNSHTADTLDCNGNLPSADDQLTLWIYNGTSWYFASGSNN